MKKIAFLLMTIFAARICYAAESSQTDLFYFVYNGDSELFEAVDRKDYLYSPTEDPIDRYYESIEFLVKKFWASRGIDLEVGLFYFEDARGYRLYYLGVDVKNREESFSIFPENSHRSIILEEIFINFLQPFLIDWNIEFVKVSQSGVFIEHYDTEKSYGSIETKCFYRLRPELLDFGSMDMLSVSGK